LMLVIVMKCKATINKRMVRCQDAFFENLYKKLRERFFMIFNMNIVSVKTAVAKDLSAIVEGQPHYVTRRYAEFTSSVLYLSSIQELASFDPLFIQDVQQGLSRLREEMEKLLIRLIDAMRVDWRSKSIYLINNYDLILSIIGERGITSPETQQFQKLRDIKTTDYAQDELNRSFGRLITFTTTYGTLVKTATPESASTTPKESDQKINAREDEVESLLRDFHNNWKQELDQIYNGIMKQFSNFKYGQTVFNKIMEDLLENYKLFVLIIKKYFKNLRMSKYFTPETEITYEMKKHFVAFE